MHLIQHEHPDTYHVVRWENSAFHNHGGTVSKKRKMLGGVSFDQGAVSGGQSHTKAPASFGMPASMPANDKNISGIGLGVGPGNTIDAGKGKEADKSAGKDNKEKTGKYKTIDDAIQKTFSGIGNGGFKKVTSLMASFYRKVRYSLRAGIGTKQHKQEKKKNKKNISGTRPVSKEDMYIAQAGSSYLLDSYNKFGERSVLGK